MLWNATIAKKVLLFAAEKGKKPPGWTIVTSRRDKSTLCDGMNKNQKLTLDALPVMDSMAVLWRRKNSMPGMTQTMIP